ncbi:hypothetical protein [Ilyomonas limi]|nr:hypothetical protein [Ilyomonas limi]
MVPDTNHLQLLLDELNESGYIHFREGVVLQTYSITDKGINEGARIDNEA